MRLINKIIIHCTATKEGEHYTAKDVDCWHKTLGWRSIGYHYLVHLDGTIEQGRAEREVGAHCYGQNANSLGICYVGGLDATGKPADTRTPAQILALRQLVVSLRRRYAGLSVYGHNQFSNKDCPCFNVQNEF